MSPAIDPILRLALALSSSRGAYAALLGSGVSVAAGIPTGRQIVVDLITKLAALDGVSSIGDDPFAWYREKYDEEPDYSRLLDAVAASPTERSELLRGYFEPTDDQRRRGLRVPGASHHALARLAAGGYVSVFLTTNFDRLLEQALERAGVAPVMISTPDALEGASPLGRARCTVVKLHGDYLDTRIKNTPAELDSYHPSIDRLLDRIIDEYGLIVCGWSADWDTALRRAFERAQTRRYTTFWASRSEPTGAAARLIALRGAEVVRIKDADTLFTGLIDKLSVLDGTAALGREQVSVPAVTNLPARAATFVGRTKELAEIHDHLRNAAVRLLTVLGPGGAGKTALAIEAARSATADFADGVTFVDLSATSDPVAVPVFIARAMGLEEVTDRPPKDVLIDHLRGQYRLLILDNFEQVVGAAGLVGELLAASPRTKILVTSRESLRIRGEHVYPLPPLGLPPADARRLSAEEVAAYEAVQLFVDRARAIRPEFQLTGDNAALVTQICQRLDGLPLAIELAAARLQLLSLEALAHQLDNRLKLLSRGPRDLPERQRALRATIDWSYQLLTPDEQSLLQLLSVFFDPDLAAVEAVAREVLASSGASVDVLDAVSSLADKSLITRFDLPSRDSRIGMLATIREFASEQLARRADIAARSRQAHANYYSGLVGRLLPELSGSRRLEALEAMVADVPNLHLAWNYWLSARGIAQLEQLANGLLILNEVRGWPLDTVRLSSDLLSILEEEVSSPESIESQITLRASLARALMTVKGYTPEVEEAFARSLDLFEERVENRHQFSVLRGLVSHYSFRGDVQKAMRIGQRMLVFAQGQNDPAMQIEGHLLVGVNTMFNGGLRGGLNHLERAIELFGAVPPHAFTSRTGGPDPRVACHTTSALALWLLGYPDGAVTSANAALSLAAELDHPFTLAFAHFHCGLLHLWRRDFDATMQRAQSLLEVANAHEFVIWQAAGGVLSGASQVGLGRFDEGLVELHGGMKLYQGLRSPPVFWPILLTIQATAQLHSGRPGEALAAADMALDLFSSGGGSTMLPEVDLLKGDLLSAIATAEGREVGEADKWYRSGFERARNIGARISALRAAVRLCRTARDAAARENAQGVLSEIYSGFTEGRTTPDLQEAADLLAAGESGTYSDPRD